MDITANDMVSLAKALNVQLIGLPSAVQASELRRLKETNYVLFTLVLALRPGWLDA